MTCNVKNQGVDIQIQGEIKKLLYDMNAFIILEDAYGSLEEVFKQLDSGKLSAIRKLLYAGLLHTDENLTEKQIGNLFDLSDLTKLVDTVSAALILAMPEAKEEVKVELGEPKAKKLNKKA
jgi:hypothetical protein